MKATLTTLLCVVAAVLWPAHGQAAYSCSGPCATAAGSTTPYCPLTSNNALACPSNLCLSTCALGARPDVAAHFLCRTPFAVNCTNMGAVLSTWCPAHIPYLRVNTTLPVCYTESFARCMAQCSNPAVTPSLLLPSATLNSPATPATLSPASIFTPQDVAFPTTSNSPAGQDATKAVDGLSTTKYLNFDEFMTGLIVVPVSGFSVVAGISITTAGDAPERDPTSVIVESANAMDSANFYYVTTFVLNGAYLADTTRGKTWIFRLPAVYVNHVPHNIYRLRFPTVRNPTTANSMQVAEVQLLGLGCAVNDLVPNPLTTSTSCAAGGSVLLGTTCTVTTTVTNCPTIQGTTVTTRRTCTGIYPSTRMSPTGNFLSSSSTNAAADVPAGQAVATSVSGGLNFVVQHDCHLVLYRGATIAPNALWASNTVDNSTGVCRSPRLRLTGDGALVFFADAGIVRWRSGPGGRTDGPFTLFVGDNPAAVYLVNAVGTILWSTLPPTLVWTGANPTCPPPTTTTTTTTTTSTTTTTTTTTTTVTTTTTATTITLGPPTVVTVAPISPLPVTASVTTMVIPGGTTTTLAAGVTPQSASNTDLDSAGRASTSSTALAAGAAAGAAALVLILLVAILLARRKRRQRQAHVRIRPDVFFASATPAPLSFEDAPHAVRNARTVYMNVDLGNQTYATGMQRAVGPVHAEFVSESVVDDMCPAASTRQALMSSPPSWDESSSTAVSLGRGLPTAIRAPAQPVSPSQWDSQIYSTGKLTKGIPAPR